MGRISGFGVVETLLPLGAAEIDDERLWPHEIFGKRPLRSVYYLGADAPFLPSLRIVLSTIDAIEMPDLDGNRAESARKAERIAQASVGLTVKHRRLVLRL